MVEGQETLGLELRDVGGRLFGGEVAVEELVGVFWGRNHVLTEEQECILVCFRRERERGGLVPVSVRRGQCGLNTWICFYIPLHLRANNPNRLLS